MRHSIICWILRYPLVLSLGATNVQALTQDLVSPAQSKNKFYISSCCEGHVTVIVNGRVLTDEVISFFQNSYNDRPTSLEGKEYKPWDQSHTVNRKTDFWKKSGKRLLVSKSRRCHKCECIRV